MDLTILFSPIDESVYSEISSPSSFLKSIRIFGDKMPSYKDSHIAIFGVKEGRGSNANAGSSNAPDEIRKKLYNIYEDIMINQSVPWVDISGDYEERLQKAIVATDKLLK